MMNKCILAATILVCSLTGCGRYGPPVPPTALAPQKPKSASVRLEANTVIISWANPSEDRRGKSLISLEDVKVYRRQLPSVLQISDSSPSEWELIKQEMISNFEAKKSKGGAPGPLAAVAAAPSAKSSAQVSGLIEYRDTLPSSDGVYQYVLQASNQGGVEGDVSDIYQVSFFKNGTSEVVVIPNSKNKLPS